MFGEREGEGVGVCESDILNDSLLSSVGYAISNPFEKHVIIHISKIILCTMWDACGERKQK